MTENLQYPISLEIGTRAYQVLTPPRDTHPDNKQMSGMAATYLNPVTHTWREVRNLDTLVCLWQTILQGVQHEQV